MKVLKSKAGVTVLEGVIAMGLLAMITAGAFGVLLSASRQSSAPDIQEEMRYAVEKANDLLKAYLGSPSRDELPDDLKCGPCGNFKDGACVGPDRNPLEEEVDLTCLLPPVCDRRNSSFTYTISSANLQDDRRADESKEVLFRSAAPQGYVFSFEISCNGYEL